MSFESVSLLTPNDFHIHLREGAALKLTVPHAAEVFENILVMPNLKTPVFTTEQALRYRDEIKAHIPEGQLLTPWMTLYLSDTTHENEMIKAKASECVLGAKLYPAHATTNSSYGVTKIENIYPVLAMMEKVGLFLEIHGEVTEPHVDVFDREAIFIETILIPLLERFPALKIVLEHITTEEAVECVKSYPNLGATITPHHLVLNRNAIFEGGIRPHHYCLPILKREKHRQALVEAALLGHERFFLGTDSAPHRASRKETSCGCAGIYNVPVTMPLLAHLFEQHQALHQLEYFTSRAGSAFYGLAPNQTHAVLQKTQVEVPTSYPFFDEKLIPLHAGQTLPWSFSRREH